MGTQSWIAIDGLSFDLVSLRPNPVTKNAKAIITLNVPRPYAEGNDFPGVDFGIRVRNLETNEEHTIAEGGFTYESKTPESTARCPTTVVGSIRMDNLKNTVGIYGMWRAVKRPGDSSCFGHIDSLCSISAVVSEA